MRKCTRRLVGVCVLVLFYPLRKTGSCANVCPLLSMLLVFVICNVARVLVSILGLDAGP